MEFRIKCDVLPEAASKLTLVKIISQRFLTLYFISLSSYSVNSLKQFYVSSSHLQYFKNLIQVPQLPDVSHSFLLFLVLL